MTLAALANLLLSIFWWCEMPAETYLINMVNERVIPMLENLNTLFLPDVKITRVLPIKAHSNNAGVFPYWSVYAVPPGRSALVSRAGLGHGRATHIIGMRLWFSSDTAGANAGADHISWLNWIGYPTTVLYFMRRPSMCVDDTQEDADYLDPAETVIELASEIGPLPDTTPSVLGMDFHLALTFNFALNNR